MELEKRHLEQMGQPSPWRQGLNLPEQSQREQSRQGQNRQEQERFQPVLSRQGRNLLVRSRRRQTKQPAKLGWTAQGQRLQEQLPVRCTWSTGWSMLSSQGSSTHWEW